MKALSIWSYNGGCFMVPQMDSELGSSCSLGFGKRRCCGYLFNGRNYSLSVVSGNWRPVRDRVCCGSSNSDVGFWSLSGQSKLRCIIFGGMRKKGSFGAFFALALALALEQEAVGDELVKEGQVSVNGSSDEEAVEGVIDIDVNKNIEFRGEEGVMKKKSKWVDVRRLTGKLRSAKTADNVEEVLKDMSELPHQVYATMIKGLGYDLLMDSAKALVEWLKRKKIEDGFVGPNIFIYNSLLGAAKRSKQYGEAEKIMNDMAQEGITPNLVTYNTLMCIYGDQGEFDKAHNILEEIPKRGFSPNAVSYSTALLAYRSTGDANGAIRFFAKYSEKYLTDDTQKDGDVNWEKEYVKFENLTLRICYVAMRGWLVDSENLSTNVLRLLTQMDKVGIKLTREDLQRLVWACTRKEHYIVAKDLYGRIREGHSEINLSVCNHVIWLFGNARKWWAALEVYEDLLDKGPRPDNLSRELIMSHFNFLLKKAKQKGIWRWGVKLINQMVDKGLKPGAGQWNAVLAACSKACDTTAAVQIFKRMVEQGEKPTMLTYGILLSALEKGKFYDEALRLWNHMIKVGLEPNDYAYTIMASIFSAQEKFDMVDVLIRDMAASGVEPTVVTYNAIISGCAHNRRSSVAYEWFHRMKVQNIAPNEITYEMMVQALGNDGKPRLAYEMYLRARGEGISLSARAYDAVVGSSQAYEATVDLSALGPRPADPIKKMDIRKNARKQVYVREDEEGTNELYAHKAKEGSNELYSREAEEGSDELYSREAEEGSNELHAREAEGSNE